MNLQVPEYINTLQQLKEKIRYARIRAAFSVNTELLKLYWEIGNTILLQQEIQGWGAKVIEKLATDLRSEFTDLKGLSIRNLKYMRAFAQAYPELTQVVNQYLIPDVAQNQFNQIVQAHSAQLNNNNPNEFVQAMLAQLSWYHHTTLLDKVKDKEIRQFYIQQTIENGWSRDVMVHQIEGGLHERKGNILSNFKNTIPDEHSELVQQVFKDPYKFEFIYLGKEAKEKDLEDALLTNVIKVLLELGVGFAFLGKQVKFEAGGREFYIDLLFYHTKLRRHIIVELKIGDFEPEYISKMNLYLELADDQLSSKYDEPAIGLILCKTKNKVIAEYALRDTNKPIGIAEYKIAEQLPENIKGELPSIEELEIEIEKEVEELKKPTEKKLEQIKKLMQGLKQPKVKEKRNPENTEKIFTQVVLPIRNHIKNELTEISKDFEETEIMIWTNHQGHRIDEEVYEWLKKYGETDNFKIEIRLRGCKPAGTKAFDVWKQVHIQNNTYNYSIYIDGIQQNSILEKLYHQLLEQNEFNEIIEKVVGAIYRDIEQQLKRINPN